MIAAFSLSHLLFLRVWADHLIPLESTYFDYTRHPAGPENIVGLWLAAAVLLIPLAKLFQISSHPKTGVRQAASVTITLLFAIVVVVVFHILFKNGVDDIHTKNIFLANLSADAVWILVAQALGLFLWGLTFHGDKVYRVVRTFLVLLAPFPLVVSPQIINKAFTAPNRNLGVVTTTPRPHPAALKRTVVVVMDELDYSLVFENERTLAVYPNFHDLQKQSLSATQAFPPAQNTLLSLASYWYGKNATRFTLRPAQAPQLEFFNLDSAGEGAGRSLASVADLFSEAATLGASTEIVGWSHPYCDLFSGVVARCFHSSYQQGNNGEGVFDSFTHAFARLGETLSRSGMTDPSFIRGAHLAAYHEFVRRSTAAVGNPENDLVWLHLSIPHEPIIYDSVQQVFRTSGLVLDGSYADNVALADLTLGLLTASLKRAGLWEKTQFLLVSDHAYRRRAVGETPADQRSRMRVPFLLKTASAGGLRFDAPFSTRVVGPLTLHLLKGDFSTSASVWRWMDRERQADKTFLRTAYAGGKKRCADYPFVSERNRFEMWSEFDPECSSPPVKDSQRKQK